jgi:hypothetical protein
MSVPTSLDFAIAYPAPMPATVAREFEMLSNEDRIGAVAMAKQIAAGARGFNKRVPLGAAAFLSLKPWREKRDAQ